MSIAWLIATMSVTLRLRVSSRRRGQVDVTLARWENSVRSKPR
jgi:hypothetical protein